MRYIRRNVGVDKEQVGVQFNYLRGDAVALIGADLGRANKVNSKFGFPEDTALCE